MALLTQTQAIEQYFHVLLFITLHNVVLTFGVCGRNPSIQFTVVLFNLLYNVVLAVESVEEILNTNPVSDDDVKNITCVSSKSIYSALVKGVQLPPTAQSKFDSFYNISNILDWKNIYQLPGRVTLDTRTRAFQYKILNRILYTNSILYKMKLVPSLLCTYCGDHEETLDHLLVKCVYTKEVWSATTSWLNNHNIQS